MRQFVGAWLVSAVLTVGSVAIAPVQAGAQPPAPQGAASEAVEAQDPVPPGDVPLAVPAAQGTAAPVAPGQAPVVQAPVAVAPPIQGRVFTGGTGLIFNAVRTERVSDFERALGYFVAALEKSTDPDVRAQAKGWRIMKAAEPGPNDTVLYVFILDPTVPNADYSLGPILAEAYPEAAELQQIWKLYTSSVTSGGTLLNLSPVEVPAPTGPLTLPPPPAAAGGTAAEP